MPAPTLDRLRTVPARFLAGFTAPWQGFLWLWRRPALWRYGLLAIGFNLLLTVAILVGLALGGWLLWARWGPALPENIFGTLAFVGLLLAGAVLLLAAGVVTWMLLGGAVTGWLCGRLVECLERDLGLDAAAIRPIPLRYQVVDAGRDTLSLAVVNGLLLLLNVVPGVGSAAAAAGAFLFDAWLFGRDYLDLPLELRAWRREAKLEFFRLHRPEVLGLGAAVMLLQMVPVVGAVALSTAAAGAVLLVRRVTDTTALPAKTSNNGV